MGFTKEQIKGLSGDDLLILIIEECSEVIKEACKIKRFGPCNCHPEDPGTKNYQRLMAEYGHLRDLGDEFAHRWGTDYKYPIKWLRRDGDLNG